MKKTLKRTACAVMLILTVVMAIVAICAVQPNTATKMPQTIASAESKNRNAANSAEESEGTPYAFGRLQTEYNVNGARVRVDLDARDSIFGDDILITFEEMTGKTIDFHIKVTFIARTGTVNEGWSKTGISGNRLMNSGKTSVHTMECYMEITYNKVTAIKTHTFEVY